jgi:hypothetical protein
LHEVINELTTVFPVFIIPYAPPSGQGGWLQAVDNFVQAGLQFHAELSDFTDEAGFLVRVQDGEFNV